VRRVDCSKFSDPRPRNSCRQVVCFFSTLDVFSTLDELLSVNFLPRSPPFSFLRSRSIYRPEEFWGCPGRRMHFDEIYMQNCASDDLVFNKIKSLHHFTICSKVSETTGRENGSIQCHSRKWAEFYVPAVRRSVMYT